MSDDDNSYRNPDLGDDGWPKDEALKGLVMERRMHPDETEEQLSRRLLRENAPEAVSVIIHTAIHGSTDRIRLEASKYVVERVLGRVGDDLSEGEKTPIAAFIDDVNDMLIAAANASNPINGNMNLDPRDD